MLSKKIIISSILTVLLIAGILVFAINSENTRTEKKKSDEKLAMTQVQNPQNPQNPQKTMMTKSDSLMPQIEAVVTKGTYLPYNVDLLKNATTGNVVLFFNAFWCPTCQSMIKDLNSKTDKIPSSLTILTADYDKETSLKQKYGVTMQHTFVKVDKDGNLLKKASGLENLEAIINFVK